MTRQELIALMAASIYAARLNHNVWMKLGHEANMSAAVADAEMILTTVYRTVDA